MLFHNHTKLFARTVIVIFLVGFSFPLSHAMHIESMAVIDDAGESPCKDSQFKSLKELMEKGPDARNCFLAIAQSIADKLRILHGLNASISACFLSDQHVIDIFSFLGKSVSSSANANGGELVPDHMNCLNGVNNVPALQAPSINLVALQKKVKDGKIAFSRCNLQFIDGFVLPESHMKDIKDIDLSMNHLTVPGIDSMNPFKLFHNLQKLNLAHNNLDRLPSHFFDNIPWCIVVSLAHNDIKTIEQHAFAGARSVAINLCGNPIQEIEAGALNAGQHKVVVFCSKNLPKEILDTMTEQLGASDLRSKSLTSCLNFAKSLSNLNGYTHMIIVVAAAAVWTIIIFPGLYNNHINPLNFKAISATAACTAASLFLFYGLLRVIQGFCETSVENKRNMLIPVMTRFERRIQKDLFES